VRTAVVWSVFLLVLTTHFMAHAICNNGYEHLFDLPVASLVSGYPSAQDQSNIESTFAEDAS
jgi:hypothetical protein